MKKKLGLIGLLAAQMGLEMIDYTINIGVILQVLAVIGGVIAFLRKENTVKRKEDAVAITLTNDVNYIKEKVKSISELVTSRAVMEKDIMNMKEDIRELRHGDGFVLPKRSIAPGNI